MIGSRPFASRLSTETPFFSTTRPHGYSRFMRSWSSTWTVRAYNGFSSSSRYLSWRFKPKMRPTTNVRCWGNERRSRTARHPDRRHSGPFELVGLGARSGHSLSYSITRSARASRAFGITRPSALAVCILIDKINVGELVSEANKRTMNFLFGAQRLLIEEIAFVRNDAGPDAHGDALIQRVPLEKNSAGAFGQRHQDDVRSMWPTPVGFYPA
jgi:hypothetical protein